MALTKPLSDGDYKTLDRFIKKVLERVANDECEVGKALADIMHPLTAWDKGDEQEFAIWMAARLKEWE